MKIFFILDLFLLISWHFFCYLAGVGGGGEHVPCPPLGTPLVLLERAVIFIAVILLKPKNSKTELVKT